MKDAIETIADEAVKKEIEKINRLFAEAIRTESHIVARCLKELPDSTLLAQWIDRRLDEVRKDAISAANRRLVVLLSTDVTPIAA